MGSPAGVDMGAPGDFAAVLIANVTHALALGWEAMRLLREMPLREMPRGPWLTGFGGGARGYGVCRICLYEGHGALLVRRRAFGRHLRAHAHPTPPEGSTP